MQGVVEVSSKCHRCIKETGTVTKAKSLFVGGLETSQKHLCTKKMPRIFATKIQWPEKSMINKPTFLASLFAQRQMMITANIKKKTTSALRPLGLLFSFCVELMHLSVFEMILF